jgi:outer membrane protein
MKRSLPIMFLGVALIIAGMVRADAAGTSAKIGFVDLQRTLFETKAGKSARKRFESQKKKKQASLDKKQKDFQRYAAELEKQRILLESRPAKLAQREKELQNKYVEVQQTYAKLERELSEAQANLIKEILGKAGPVIQSIGKREGYTIILDRSAVLWAADAADLTDKVNKRIK